MAGQTPDPSFQPAEQDAGLTQGRPAWQAPAGYPPPPGSGGAQAYAAPAPGYPQQEQGYPGSGQPYPGAGQDYPAGSYQPYGTPPPQWKAETAGTRSSRQPKPAGEKGFVGSLLDFSFSSFVTPKIIKVLYVLVAVWTALLALTILILGFKTGGMAGGLFTLIIIEPVFILLALGIYRVVLEAFMVVFRLYEEMKKLRENLEGRS